jgi:cytochrome c biogenesis protein CcmG, thiol:disulfide interchange protein DsbE
MKFLRKIAPWCTLGFALLVMVRFVMPTYRQGEASIAGKTADDFPLELNNQSIHLTNLQGKVVVLNFWASWCGPCVEETPALNRLQQRIATKGGMVLAVSVDEDPDAYQKFLKEQGVSFPAYRASWDLAHSYGSKMIPETYIIDRHGKIIRKVIGPQQWDSPDMLTYFDAILGQS